MWFRKMRRRHGKRVAAAASMRFVCAHHHLKQSAAACMHVCVCKLVMRQGRNYPQVDVSVCSYDAWEYFWLRKKTHSSRNEAATVPTNRLFSNSERRKKCRMLLNIHSHKRAHIRIPSEMLLYQKSQNEMWSFEIGDFQISKKLVSLERSKFHIIAHCLLLSALSAVHIHKCPISMGNSPRKRNARISRKKIQMIIHSTSGRSSYEFGWWFQRWCHLRSRTIWIFE